MAQRRRFSAEYKREAVAMLESPGVSVSQIATELGIGATVLGRGRRKLRRQPVQAFQGQDRPRDEELVLLRREDTESPRSGIFCEKRQRALRARRDDVDDVSDDPTLCRDAFLILMMCRCLQVSPQRVLRLGEPGTELREPRRMRGYLRGSVCCIPTMTGSGEVRASGKTCATPGSGVDATEWRA